MYTREITSEKRYTLEEAKHIMNERRNAKIKALFYKAKQKLLGVILLLMVVVEFTAGYFNLIDEGGAFIFALPLGLYLLFTKERVIM